MIKALSCSFLHAVNLSIILQNKKGCNYFLQPFTNLNIWLFWVLCAFCKEPVNFRHRGVFFHGFAIIH